VGKIYSYLNFLNSGVLLIPSAFTSKYPGPLTGVKINFYPYCETLQYLKKEVPGLGWNLSFIDRAKILMFSLK
jgi:hypothetical protein